MSDINEMPLPSMVGTIEKMMEQVQDGQHIAVLCGDGCWNETFVIRLVGREAQVLCPACDRMVLHVWFPAPSEQQQEATSDD